MKYHYIDQYIASSQHKITINLVGAGGTGSHVLTNLAMINHSLIALSKQPLFVKVFDPDEVTATNVGRQTFSPADIGQNKAEVLVTRINRFYGTHWHSVSELYSVKNYDKRQANITISCVDSVRSRQDVFESFNLSKNYRSYDCDLYWMDIGNRVNSGQIILGTTQKIKQPRGGKSSLPNFFDEFTFETLFKNEDENQPSCSMAEALARQDLFINKIMASYATHMLWELLTQYRISYRAIYVNLENMKTSKVMIS